MAYKALDYRLQTGVERTLSALIRIGSCIRMKLSGGFIRLGPTAIIAMPLTVNTLLYKGLLIWRKVRRPSFG